MPQAGRGWEMGRGMRQEKKAGQEARSPTAQGVGPLEGQFPCRYLLSGPLISGTLRESFLLLKSPHAGL